ncbi:conserved unknown protein [Ectocarpus siliculosus]|uniref:Uncharacterized protein n=1 Tax=Ectocarpus siliculosus TaxID=2880 RepID=D8LJS5_ECTSI|nr:conserved unknown protein [Ectocarpus siliculosus]|eukprot:CBN75995.1 conserved unknown protein [Ectocarpus siliculosus]
MPTSFRVRRSSPRPALLYSLISASLVLLLVVSAGLLPPTRTTATAPERRLPDIMSEKTEDGVSPQQQQQQGGGYRANRVAAGNDFVKFVLQESVGSDGRDPAEAATWRTLNFREVADLFKKGLPDCFLESMKEANFEAVFWESAPVTRTTTDKPYEYVLVDSPRLAAVTADGRPFAEHIASRKGTNDVVSFRNLRRDARLVVPCRGGQQPGANYAHLAAFLRTAPRDQVVQFFGAVGEGLEDEIASRADETPVWLSTSGLGVYWLHARLDSVPKYYTYAPFKAL